MGTAHTDSVTVLRAMLGGGEGEWLGVRTPDIGLADGISIDGYIITRLAMTRGGSPPSTT